MIPRNRNNAAELACQGGCDLLLEDSNHAGQVVRSRGPSQWWQRRRLGPGEGDLSPQVTELEFYLICNGCPRKF